LKATAVIFIFVKSAYVGLLSQPSVSRSQLPTSCASTHNLPFHFSKGHEPEAIDFVLAALHAHIGVLQWAEEKTAANGGLHMLKWN
jgi:hypothetical protein